MNRLLIGIAGGVFVTLIGGCTPVLHPEGELEERLSAIQNRPPDCDERGLPNLARRAPIGDVLRCAFLGNPGIRTEFNEWVAALERVPQAGALANPSLSLSLDAQYLLGFDPMRRLGIQKPGEMQMKPPGGDWMTMRTREMEGSGRFLDAVGLGFEQMFPGAGKRQARAEKALLEARAAGLRFLNAERELRQAVIAAYAELLYNRRRADVEEENVRLFREIRDITLNNLAAGIGNQADVLKSEVSITEAETDLRAVRVEEPRLRAQLNALLGRRADAKFGELMGVEVKWTKKKAPELLELAVWNNPELSALAAEIQSQGASVLLAELEYNPDFSLGTNIGAMQQMLMAGVSLPIYRERIEAGIREAVATRAAAQTRWSSAVFQTMARLIASLTEIEDAERILEDYGDKLVPQLRELVRVQLETYGAGEGAFLDILDTRRSFIQSARLLIRAEAERLQALAMLEEVTGANLIRLKAVDYDRSRYTALQKDATERTGAAMEEVLVELPPADSGTTGAATLPAGPATELTTSPAAELTTSPAAAAPAPAAPGGFPPATVATPAPSPAIQAAPPAPGRAPTPAPSPALTPLPIPQPVRRDTGTTVGVVRDTFRQRPLS